MPRKRTINVPNKDASKKPGTNHTQKEAHIKTRRNNDNNNNKSDSKKYILLLALISACVIAIYPDVLSTIYQYYVINPPTPGTSNEADTNTNTGGEDVNVQPQSTSGPANTKSKSHKDDIPPEIPDEVKNFQPHWQKSFTAKKIFAGGRRIPPLELIPQKETNSSVKLYLFDNFLSDSECDGLIKAHDRHVQEMDDHPLLCFDSLDTLKQHISQVGMKITVTPNVFSPGTTCLNATLSNQIQYMLHSNWSYSTAFYPKESKFSTIASNRLKEAMGLNPESGGKFQITSYPIGKAYKTHTDCVLDSHELRDRAVSVIMYLNDVHDGGETKFPELGISVEPKKGRALVWNNMSPDGHCEPHSRHVASVVKSGSKYILMRWYYYKSFYSIGKRMAGPSLPPRQEDVPMVMCDKYTHGSCRWYDEWTPQVLTQYLRNQHNYV